MVFPFDEPATQGSLVMTRLIAVMEAEQTEEGKTERNDRLIGVAAAAHDYRSIESLEQLSDDLLTYEKTFTARIPAGDSVRRKRLPHLDHVLRAVLHKRADVADRRFKQPPTSFARSPRDVWSDKTIPRAQQRVRVGGRLDREHIETCSRDDVTVQCGGQVFIHHQWSA